MRISCPPAAWEPVGRVTFLRNGIPQSDFSGNGQPVHPKPIVFPRFHCDLGQICCRPEPITKSSASQAARSAAPLVNISPRFLRSAVCPSRVSRRRQAAEVEDDKAVCKRERDEVEDVAEKNARAERARSARSAARCPRRAQRGARSAPPGFIYYM